MWGCGDNFLFALQIHAFVPRLHWQSPIVDHIYMRKMYLSWKEMVLNAKPVKNLLQFKNKLRSSIAFFPEVLMVHGVLNAQSKIQIFPVLYLAHHQCVVWVPVLWFALNVSASFQLITYVPNMQGIEKRKIGNYLLVSRQYRFLLAEQVWSRQADYLKS